ncbi:cell wall mannoprotein 1 family protein [Aspergillus undulatus]|uniref:cell wall mannoprotein 1 family protein n=1 Tax=Aspergillus undulatus TaxID=1810928 RepID=UPI003CCE5003
MKLTTIFVPTILLAGALAERIHNQKRALEDYEEILDTVTAQIDVAGADLNNYIAGTVPGTVVQDSAAVLVTLINDAAETVTGLDPISVLDALNLLGPITTLTNDVDDLTNTLIAAEPNFISDGLADEVLLTLYDFRDAGENLRDAITPKVPAALQSIANSLADQVVADVQRAIDAYSD